MRALSLRLMPALVLTGTLVVVGCGSSDSLPTGSWHPTTGTIHGGGSGSGTGSGTSSGNGATGSSSGGQASTSSSGGSSSSGASGSGGSSSGGASSGATGSSSGGGTSSSGGSAVSPSAIAVTLDQSTLQMPLMESSVVHVSIAPNGYMGSVTLSAGTLPSGVTAAFSEATVSLDGTATATSTLTLTTATDAAPGDASLEVGVGAGGQTKTAPLALTVQSMITIHIPAGVNNTGATTTNPNTGAFGPYPITFTAPANFGSSNPITVYFKNDDNVSHEIHADNASQGFGHDPGPIGAGQMDSYVRKVVASGTFDFYLHDQNAPITVGRVFIP